MTRSRMGSPLPFVGLRRSSRVHDQFLFSYILLPSHAPLPAFGTVHGNLSVWMQVRVAAAFRGVKAYAGLPVSKYALRSLRIRCAIFLSVGEASAKK